METEVTAVGKSAEGALNSFSRINNSINVNIHLPEKKGFLNSGDNRGIIRAMRGGISPKDKDKKKFKNRGFDITLENGKSIGHPNAEIELYRMPYKYIGPKDVKIEGEKVRISTGPNTFVLLWPCDSVRSFTCSTGDIYDLADWILVKAGNGAEYKKPHEGEVTAKLMEAEMEILDERIAERETQAFLKKIEARRGGKRKTRKRKRKYKRRKTCKGGKTKKRTQKRGKKKARKTRRR